MDWKITISSYKKKSKEIPKEFRRYSIAVGYVKKWEKMWHAITTKNFKYPWATTSEKQIMDYANILWAGHFKRQPRQVLIFLGDELKFGRDNLDKYRFT